MSGGCDTTCHSEAESDTGSMEAYRRPSRRQKCYARDQWVVGFALETEDIRFRAIVKMSRKCCDMIVSNSASAMNSEDNSVEVILRDGTILEQITGTKPSVANGILSHIQKQLIERAR